MIKIASRGWRYALNWRTSWMGVQLNGGPVKSGTSWLGDQLNRGPVECGTSWMGPVELGSSWMGDQLNGEQDLTKEATGWWRWFIRSRLSMLISRVSKMSQTTQCDILQLCETHGYSRFFLWPSLCTKSQFSSSFAKHFFKQPFLECPYEGDSKT